MSINKQTKKNKERKYSYIPFVISSQIFEEYKKMEIINKLKPNSDGEIKKHDILNSFFEIKNNADKSISKPGKKLNLTSEVLSEENFVQNNLDIYKLFEQCKIERMSPFENDKMKTKIC